MKPYYQDESCTIYHGDCREILSLLPKCDLVLTDPPYGIKRDKGMGAQGYDGFGNGVKRKPRTYHGDWDSERPSPELLKLIAASAPEVIIWGGNYFTDCLPIGRKWLVWDKCQTMPSFSDVELAWTNLDGIALKMLRLNGSGLMAVEQDRVHPTQKPVGLMCWCIQKTTAQLILDPFMGSGSTLIASKDLCRKSIGIEIEERYCEIAAKRLAQEVLPLGC